MKVNDSLACILANLDDLQAGIEASSRAGEAARGHVGVQWVPPCAVAALGVAPRVAELRASASHQRASCRNSATVSRDYVRR